MRKLIPVLISIIGCVVLVLTVWLSYSEDVQAVYISPTVRSLGTVNPAVTEMVSATFRLNNRTDRPLTLTKTMTSCMCTRLRIPGLAIPSGGHADLIMEVKTRGIRGHQRVTSQIWTDNSEFPYFEIAANGDFTDGDSVSPFSVIMPPLTPRQSVHFEFDISGFSVETISSKLLFDTLKVDFESRKRDDISVSKLVFDGIAPDLKGAHSAKFAAVLSGVSRPVDVNVYLDVVDRVEAIPPIINFGLVGRSAEPVRELRVIDRRSIAIKSVVVEQGSQDVSIEQSQIVGAVAKLSLKFRASPNEKLYARELHLIVTLRDGVVEKLSLPLKARFIDTP
jgi:Protein of unknown function (DUF1573)